MTLNKATLIGHVGQNPDIRHTKEGKIIAAFSLATSEYWTDKRTGDRDSRTEWHRIVVFSESLAGVVKNYVKKGTKLYLEGQLRTRKWTDNKGIDKYVTEVVLHPYNATLKLLSGKPDEAEQTQGNDSASSTVKTTFSDQEGDRKKMDDIANSFGDENADHLNDDIPF